MFVDFAISERFTFVTLRFVETNAVGDIPLSLPSSKYPRSFERLKGCTSIHALQAQLGPGRESEKRERYMCRG